MSELRVYVQIRTSPQLMRNLKRAKTPSRKDETSAQIPPEQGPAPRDGAHGKEAHSAGTDGGAALPTQSSRPLSPVTGTSSGRLFRRGYPAAGQPLASEPRRGTAPQSPGGGRCHAGPTAPRPGPRRRGASSARPVPSAPSRPPPPPRGPPAPRRTHGGDASALSAHSPVPPAPDFSGNHPRTTRPLLPAVPRGAGAALPSPPAAPHVLCSWPPPPAARGSPRCRPGAADSAPPKFLPAPPPPRLLLSHRRGEGCRPWGRALAGATQGPSVRPRPSPRGHGTDGWAAGGSSVCIAHPDPDQARCSPACWQVRAPNQRLPNPKITLQVKLPLTARKGCCLRKNTCCLEERAAPAPRAPLQSSVGQPSFFLKLE
ncbi:formin-like protein 3 [Corvus hawaiiensis]|uniref:formin-like protein 3 n=1 Tax=Corvus hawaiiensis TaxID=134902 RepID=UPI002019FB4F|nr:formin-like protein 3 [Corvus hawaiiensis]